MSFHAKERRALTVFASVVETRPELADRALKLKEHYLGGGVEKPSPHLLHAALRLMTEEDFSSAVRLVSNETSAVLGQAERHLIDAINNGPDFLKQSEEFLHSKGVMRGANKYFLGFKGIEPGGAYDRAWKVMDPAYRPIIAEAVEGTMKKNKVISLKVMKYVAAALRPEDDLKYLELNKLSIKYGKEHDALMKDAASFVRDMAKKHGIEVPEMMLHGLLSPKKAPHERIESLPPFITKPVAVSSAAPLRGNFKAEVAVQAAAPKFRDPQPELSPEVALKRSLDKLESRGEVSRRENKVYFYLHTEGKNGPRLISDAVEYLKRHEGVDKGERYVRLMITNVDMKLRALDAASNDSAPSNGDLHKPRAVRPQ